MSLLSGLLKIAVSPVVAVAEVVKDVSGNNSETEQALSILTLGASSVVKGAGKSLVEGVDDIFE